MKRILVTISVLIILFIAGTSIFPKEVYALEATDIKSQGQLLQIKESHAKSLEEYKEKYGNDAYGLTAYILHIVQIYSIPFCFLGIVISVLYKVIIGTRNLENAEKGLGMSIAIITITIICQVLPLIFALVIKLGKE